ncbi:hypothetical protein A4R43_25240 [Amycolatopsis albispora]|uniref:Uncharacterized protein n=1 Tax=Amycolatopsis albispora TaxID=1804986 RepID=A0A344LL59_9PSEU|nr:hypothetical protein A4R43_25240 [Amycolatopsis albispora]
MRVIVQPRFGDSAQVSTDQAGRPSMVIEVGQNAVAVLEIDQEPGSAELAAHFARDLARNAIRFSQICDEYMTKEIAQEASS